MKNSNTFKVLYLELFKSSFLRTIIRPIAIILVFLPALLSNVFSNQIKDFIGVWIIFWIVVVLLLVNIVSSKVSIGNITFFEDFISISTREQLLKIPTQDLKKIQIDYNGYLGQESKYNFPFFYSLTNKDGFGNLSIYTKDKIYNYTFQAKGENSLKGIYGAKDFYSKNQIQIEVNSIH